MSEVNNDHFLSGGVLLLSDHTLDKAYNPSYRVFGQPSSIFYGHTITHNSLCITLHEARSSHVTWLELGYDWRFRANNNRGCRASSSYRFVILRLSWLLGQVKRFYIYLFDVNGFMTDGLTPHGFTIDSKYQVALRPAIPRVFLDGSNKIEFRL